MFVKNKIKAQNIIDIPIYIIVLNPIIFTMGSIGVKAEISDKQSVMQIKQPLQLIPIKGDIFVYNGRQYRVKNRIYHSKEGFADYIELICEELTLKETETIYGKH